jgi:hypothetical protein
MKDGGFQEVFHSHRLVLLLLLALVLFFGAHSGSEARL